MNSEHPPENGVSDGSGEWVDSSSSSSDEDRAQMAAHGLSFKKQYLDEILQIIRHRPTCLRMVIWLATDFLKLSPVSAVSPILTKFTQYTPHSTCYSVPVSICWQD